MTQPEELREKISEILVKWNMPTRQVAIDEILSLLSLVKQQEREELRKKIEEAKQKLFNEMNIIQDQRGGYRIGIDDLADNLQDLLKK